MRGLRLCAGGLLLSPVALYMLLAVVGAFFPALRDDVGPPGDDHLILLADGPIHYDILLPATPEIREVFAFAADAGVPIDAPGVEWLSVGWGSRAFYTTTGDYSEISLAAIWTAVNGDAAVMRLDVLGALAEHPQLRAVRVSTPQLEVMSAKIRNDLPDKPEALPIPGFSDTDAFFPARGTFSLLRTCNVWVGDMMQGAGLDFGIWTPTPFAVTLALWWHGHLDR